MVRRAGGKMMHLPIFSNGNGVIITMRTILLLIGLSVMLGNVYGQYVSPGIRIGYDFNSHATFELKCSVGFPIGKNILNMTVGKKYAVNNRATYQSHHYLDLQAGRVSDTMTDRKIQLFYGGGIGFIYYEKDGTHHYRPRMTTFAGYLLFTTADFYLTEENEIASDLGLQLVFPIPLFKVRSFSIGG